MKHSAAVALVLVTASAANASECCTKNPMMDCPVGWFPADDATGATANLRADADLVCCDTEDGTPGEGILFICAAENGGVSVQSTGDDTDTATTTTTSAASGSASDCCKTDIDTCPKDMFVQGKMIWSHHMFSIGYLHFICHDLS